MTVLLVVLKILKVIGIVLLCILGLILIVILTVLIAPLHYRLEGQSEDELRVSIRVTYLARIVCAKVSYAKGGGLDIIVTLLWGLIKVYPKKKPDYTRDFAKDEPQFSTPGDSFEDEEPEPVDITSEEGSGSVDITLEEETGEEQPQPARKTDATDSGEPTDEKPQKESRREKKEKDDDEGGTFRERFAAFKEKWLTDGNGRAVLYIKKQIVFILKKYLPRRAKGHLTYGTGDPALTGEIYGALWLMPFMYTGKFFVTPYFDSEGFMAKGILAVNGFIQLGVVLVAALRLIINKDTRNLIKLFM